MTETCNPYVAPHAVDLSDDLDMIDAVHLDWTSRARKCFPELRDEDTEDGEAHWSNVGTMPNELCNAKRSAFWNGFTHPHHIIHLSSMGSDLNSGSPFPFGFGSRDDAGYHVPIEKLTSRVV